MCTVSYLSLKGQAIITSNRDERRTRPSARPPKAYTHRGKQLYYPQDPEGGGSWFAIDDTGNVLVLLNGAAEKHSTQSIYRRSRGMILLDLLEQADVHEAWLGIDLTDIEPFTLIHHSKVMFFQHRWDGSKKISLPLNRNMPHIWSSATLYPADIREERERWFKVFLQQHPDPNAEQLLHFHQHAGKHDTKNGLMMNRDQKLLTKNITQCLVSDVGIELKHIDLIEHSHHTLHVTY